jgi:hypothetical protein
MDRILQLPGTTRFGYLETGSITKAAMHGVRDIGNRLRKTGYGSLVTMYGPHVDTSLWMVTGTMKSTAAAWFSRQSISTAVSIYGLTITILPLLSSYRQYSSITCLSDRATATTTSATTTPHVIVIVDGMLLSITTAADVAMTPSTYMIAGATAATEAGSNAAATTSSSSATTKQPVRPTPGQSFRGALMDLAATEGT